MTIGKERKMIQINAYDKNFDVSGCDIFKQVDDKIYVLKRGMLQKLSRQSVKKIACYDRIAVRLSDDDSHFRLVFNKKV